MKDTEREIERTRRYLERLVRVSFSQSEHYPASSHFENFSAGEAEWRSEYGTGSMQGFRQMKSVEMVQISTLMGINKALFPPNIIPKTE